MKRLLERIINNEIGREELEAEKTLLSNEEIGEVENISFLQNYISKNDFSKPLMPDTVKSKLLEKLLNRYIIIPTSSVLMFLIITLTNFTFDMNEEKLNSDEIIAKIELPLLKNIVNTTQVNSKSIKSNLKETSTIKDKLLNQIPKMDNDNVSASNKNLKISKSELNKNILNKKREEINYIQSSKNLITNDNNINLSNNILKNINISISSISPFEMNQKSKYSIQNYNNIQIVANYKADNFSFGLSLRRENFQLNYNISQDNTNYNVTEFPNLTSGLISVGYSKKLGDLSPFVSLEYGLNRRGHIYGLNVGVNYRIINNLSFNLSVSNFSLTTFDNINANKFTLQYGLSVNL